MKLKNKGFSLVEAVVVVAIIGIMVAIFTGTINPIAIVGKANDSRRKKDIGRIRVAFEEYYNDENCYPNGVVIDRLMNQNNCGGSVFGPWLNNWPCDPERKTPYLVIVDGSECPSWFKIYTNLGNISDKDVPDGWYDLGQYYRVGDGSLTISEVNYGASSTNVSWYEYQVALNCGGNDCFTGSGPGDCKNTRFCQGGKCYTDLACSPECKVASCTR